jgi:hypothetical protein
LGLVQHCLLVYVHDTLAAPELEKNHIREQYKVDRPGWKALSWFVQALPHTKYDVNLFPLFFEAVAHCVVAEDTEELAWTWILFNPLFLHNIPNEEIPLKTRWKGTVLRGLVEAHAFWAAKNDFSNAFATYFRALDHGRRLSAGDPHRIPLRLAGFWLTRALMHADTSHIDPHSYLRFMRSIYIWNADRINALFVYASLQLRLPKTDCSGPSASTALKLLELCRTEPESPTIKAMLQPKSKKQAFAFFWFLVYTARVLHSGGQKPWWKTKKILDQALDYGGEIYTLERSGKLSEDKQAWSNLSAIGAITPTSQARWAVTA